MRAAQLREFNQELALTDLPVPSPGDGELLIRVRAVGLCGTDLKLTAGAIPGLTTPRVPGHEVAGEVIEGGYGFKAGQRVAAFIFNPCGTCSWCERDQAVLCPDAPRIGLERDGGLAEYLVMRARNLLTIDTLSFPEAAVSMDAVLSPWRALHVRGRVTAGERVLIAGAGGLGLHGVQIAIAAGARVGVIDPSAAHRDKALELGAEFAGGPADTGELREWAGDGVDLALEVSGSASGFATAAGELRPGGRMVVCGYRPGVDYAFDSARLALGEISVLGSRGGTLGDARQALDLVQSGAVRPLIASSGPLETVNDRLRALRSGDSIGRQVIVFD
jgi:D-arabinose 1-dehydrogenase-like Zn-dependent alcohol dehydrogenase